MFTLRIEHEIHDFEVWKAAFDRDPAGRERSGVRRYRVSRPVDDPNYILIDLDFDSPDQASDFAGAMRAVWRSPAAAPALRGDPKTNIVEVVDTAAL